MKNLTKKVFEGIEGRVDRFFDSRNARDIEVARIRKEMVSDIMDDVIDSCVGIAGAVKGTGRLMMRKDVQRTVGIVGASFSIGLILSSYNRCDK